MESFEAGECLQPTVGLCGRCDAIHADHDADGELFPNCIACQADLVELALELHVKREVD